MKVLLLGIDPEVGERAALAVHLRWPDASISVVNNREGRLGVILKEGPDLVIAQAPANREPLLQMLKEIRESLPDLPLIVLGTRQDAGETDEARILEAGADDYIRPSASMIDLLARVVALMRRTLRGNTSGRDQLMRSGPMLLNPATYDVFIDGRPISLTKTEFRLLHVLMRHEGKVVEHHVLERAVWGNGVDSAALVKKYVQRLRRKLGENADEPRWIVSVHGVGYQFVGARDEQGAERSPAVQAVALEAAV